MTEHPNKPLTVEQIEALLRSARQREHSVRTDIVSDEPLGPGDVQHLRNMAPEPLDSLGEGWTSENSTDELLHRAEHHLAEAMSHDVESPTSDDRFQPFTLPKLDSGVTSSSPGIPLAAIGDLELDVSLELGQAEMTIEQLLALREGSVVTLDREAGEPIDILANGRLIARGEIIVMDGKFCVRICEVIGQR